MPKTKLAITIERALVADLDALVANHHFVNRSQAIEAALAQKPARLANTRLAREAAKLDTREEKEFAEEGLSTDATAWPVY